MSRVIVRLETTANSSTGQEAVGTTLYLLGIAKAVK